MTDNPYTSTVERPVLDWIPRHDPRSRGFGIVGHLPYSTRRRNKLWRTGPILDQGNEGACVGFGWTAEALATPVAVDLNRLAVALPVRDPDRFARHIYRQAQTIDEWAGEAYEGTSVLAGAKSMAGVGLVREYRWCFGIEQVVDAVLGAGPVVIGVNWFSGMYEAPGGYLTRSGSLVGGHCLLVAGYVPAGSTKHPSYPDEPGLILQNSWGPEWGRDGLATIRYSELAALLDDRGEACIPTRRSYGR